MFGLRWVLSQEVQDRTDPRASDLSSCRNDLLRPDVVVLTALIDKLNFW